ncbi:hypothetical protein [Micromonospora sp. RP3T]|uniref:hypothetical protein n=1 Tax=Micromonospora sp. RP3T TaxID=2135446 RepID=UPI003D73565F
MTVTAAAQATRRAVADVFAGRALLAFYAAVLAVALFGSAQGVHGWIKWAPPAAFGAVLLAELGGVALSVFADNRRQKGERALVARIMSATFAAGAIAVQLRGHTDAAGNFPTGVGVFFAGFSAAGYVIYLLDSAAKRRDALRDQGKLAEPPPAYGAYQWTRHPWLTARARRLAVANAETRLVERITSTEQHGDGAPTTPLLGRAASLAQAAADIAAERRLAGISKTLRRRVATGVDPTMAKVAVHSWDLSKVAAGIAEHADYPALTGLLAAELTPARIHAGVTSHHRAWRWFGWFRQSTETTQTATTVAEQTEQTAPQTAADQPETAPPAWPGSAPAGARLQPIIAAAPAPAPVDPEPVLPELPAGIVVPPVPPQMPRHQQTAPQTAETDRQTDPDPEPDDQINDGPAPVDPPDEKQEQPLPAISWTMRAHLAKVITAHPNWAVFITMPSKHPDALTVAKIGAATGISGKQTLVDIRTLLLALSGTPEAAERAVGVAEPATASA